MIWKLFRQKVWNFLHRENLHRLFMLIVIALVVSSIGIAWLEDLPLFDAMWWSIVTLTTVGYGDVSPVTPGGRVLAFLVMLVGIGLFGTFSATIASVLVDQKIKEDRGMSTYQVENHLILCEWNHKTRVIIREFRADPQTADTPIVLIAANIERKPIDDQELHFIQGDVNPETLERANLAQAKTLIILADQSLNVTACDGKVVLTTLMVKSINSDVYTIVELADQANVAHCLRAKADEIIVSSELSSGLIARAALDHGITKVISQLLKNDEGDEFYKIPLPASMVGRTFIEIFTEMKTQHQSTLIAVEKKESGQVMPNPPLDYQIQADDYLIVIATDRPVISKQ